MPAAADAVLRVSVDHLLEGVQIIGTDWRYLYANQTAARHGARRPADLVGRTMMAVYPGIEQTELFIALGRVMRTRRSERFLNEFTLGDDTSRWFELLVEPVPDGICVLSVEVTGQRTAELQLAQAQKLEAIGQLASGVAHDLNNILTAVLGYAELITEQIGPDKPIGAELQEIVRAGERAAALTRHLLTFTRKRPATAVPLSVNATIEAAVPMLRRLIPESVLIETALDPAAAAVRADPVEIEQILINLAVNARDAMATGGLLTIATSNATRPSDGQGSHVTAEDCVVLRVTDTGVGMNADVRARIFEPFFTTKGPGHGTGLGLAAVQGIVARMGGSIQVESEPGAGAAFMIHLPATKEAVPARAPEARVSSPVGTETILLVEDEPGVRAFAGIVLRRYGYRVLEAETGEVALAARARGGRRPVDLLLTDVILPDMTGVDLARRMDATRAGTRVLFTSGYAEPLDGLLPAGADLLPKPFTAHTLLTRVRRALDA